MICSTRPMSSARTLRRSFPQDQTPTCEDAAIAPCRILPDPSNPWFLADIHLHRARLFGVGPVPTGQSNDDHGRSEPALQYPWESVEHDLAEARRLIVKHGYLRRTEELEDAEEAVLLKSAK